MNQITHKCHVIPKFFLKRFSVDTKKVYFSTIERELNYFSDPDRKTLEEVGVVENAYNSFHPDFSTGVYNDKLEQKYGRQEHRLANQWTSLLEKLSTESAAGRNFSFNKEQKQIVLEMLQMLLQKVIHGYLYELNLDHTRDFSGTDILNFIHKRKSNEKDFIALLLEFSKKAVGNLNFFLEGIYSRGVLTRNDTDYCTCDIPIYIKLNNDNYIEGENETTGSDIKFNNDIYTKLEFLGRPPFFEKMKDFIDVLYFPITNSFCIYIKKSTISDEVEPLNNDWVLSSGLRYMISSDKKILEDLKEIRQKQEVELNNPFSRALNDFYYIAFRNKDTYKTWGWCSGLDNILDTCFDVLKK